MTPRNPTSLYRLFDRGGRLLYVGVSATTLARLCQHAASKRWWPDVERVEVEHFPSRAEALRAEFDAIHAEAPAYNVARTLVPSLARATSTRKRADVDLVGPDEISKRLGVKPQTVAMWRYRGLLPEPLAVVSHVPVWEWWEIDEWATATGRAAVSAER